MFNSRYRHERLHDEDDFEDDVNDGHKPHPVDSPSIVSRLTGWNIHHTVFYVWIWKLLAIGKLELKDIPALPKHLNANTAYLNFKRTKEARPNSSIATLIWLAQKKQIIITAIIILFGYSLLLVAFIIFKNMLWPLMYSIDDEKTMDANLPNIAKFALILFFIFSAKTIICTYGLNLTQDIQSNIKSALYIDIFYKTLSLDLNQCDKQQILSVVTSDLNSIELGYCILYYSIHYIFLPIILFILIFVH